MTTANLFINSGKEKATKMLWLWHDGYQLDRIVKEAMEKAKTKKFSLQGMEKLLKKVDFEEAYSSDGRGDWCWALTILDETTAVLSGADSGEAKTVWFDLAKGNENGKV